MEKMEKTNKQTKDRMSRSHASSDDNTSSTNG